MAAPTPTTIPTEPIRSIPRPLDLLKRAAKVHLLNRFIDLNNLALSWFSVEEGRRIGGQPCPGNDLDSTHSAGVDYAELLPSLFELKAGNFYITVAGERDLRHALKIIRKYRKPDQPVFIGVTAPVAPHIETPEEVRDRSFEFGKNWRWC